MSPTPPNRLRLAGPYLFITWLVTLANVGRLLGEGVELGHPGVFAFSSAVLLTYAALYLLPVALPILALQALLERFSGAPRRDAVVVATLGAIGAGTVQTLLAADVRVYRLFGFHLNGFVWNVLATPGGIEAMGGGSESSTGVALIVVGLFLMQAALLLPAWLLARRMAAHRTPERERRLRRRRWIGLAGLLVLGLGERVACGLCRLHGVDAVVEAAQVFPAYQPLTFGHFARRLGVGTRRGDEGPRMRVSGGLTYPRRPLELAAERPRWNVVWLVSESLRADMVDPEVMPRVHAFAQRAQWFRGHQSGGNGTRAGMFSMFYGLYGAYWPSFQQARRGPLVVDLMLRDGYRLAIHTSATFTYPEFDQTLWADVPSEVMHEIEPDDPGAGPAWQRDRFQVDRILEFIERGAPEQPFFVFEFFESPHANYSFPDEAVIRPDYRPELSYARLRDLDEVRRDIARIKNRYVNACHHLDAEIGRILTRLEEKGLLESTIVIVTGDHGEEFLEHGRWGHNSAFTREQICPPLVLHVPGRAPAVHTRLTSHLDIPVTVLTALGVTSAPEEWSQGHDLLGPVQRRYNVICDWYAVAYSTARERAVFPLVAGLRRSLVTLDDQPVEDPKAWHAQHQAEVLEIARGLRSFTRR